MTSFCTGRISRKLQILTYVFDWVYFTQCLTSFSSINHLLWFCAWFLILFHVTYMPFSWSTHLLFLSFETLASIIRTNLPILVELINLLNWVIILLSQMTILRWLTFLLWSQTVILVVLVFWVYFSSDASIAVLQWLSLHWEILIILLSQSPLTFHQIHTGMPHFIA